MTNFVLLAALLGAGVGLGLTLAFVRLDGVQDAQVDEPGVLDHLRTRASAVRSQANPKTILICFTVLVLVWWWTGWPVAAVSAGIGAWVLPRMLGPDAGQRRDVVRIEAVAAWTESLRDTLSAAAGLEQAICATAAHAPPAIRTEVGALADRIRNGERLTDALRAFATEIDDATCDLVVTALILAADRHARHLSELLASLAVAARDQAALRMRVAAGRARIRTSTRVITFVTLAMAAALVLFNRDFLIPYDSVTGQVVLLMVVALFGFGFAWLGRIAADHGTQRALRFTERAAP